MENKYPMDFSDDSYCAWHEHSIVEDRPLKEKISSLRDSLKKKHNDDLLYLANILYELSQHCEAECDIDINYLITGKFDVPLVTDIKSDKEIPDKYIKSTSSILNKLWRKNKDIKDREQLITLSTLNYNLTDLIRTSIVAPSLYHAREFSARLKNIKRIIRNPDLSAAYDRRILKVEVDDEAKLAAGYFAYHSLIHFHTGIIVEVQIYSHLTSSWRALSHKIYEKTRVGEKLLQDLGSPESRFVSLGHLLYMADCEFERLLKELKNR